MSKHLENFIFKTLLLQDLTVHKASITKKVKGEKIYPVQEKAPGEKMKHFHVKVEKQKILWVS